jgi:hypothetical protein
MMPSPALPRLFLRAALAALCLPLFSGCGPSAKLRVGAATVLGDYGDTMKARERAWQAEARDLVTAALIQQRLKFAAEWEAKRYECRAKVGELCDAKLGELQKESVTQLEQALDPVLKKLKADLDAERAKGSTSNEREIALALQLSSTLATAQREAAKLTDHIAERMAKVRADQLGKVEDTFKNKPDLFASPTPSADEVNAILKDATANSTAAIAGIDAATTSLKGYIAADDPVKIVLQGLIGDNLGGKLGDALGKKVDELGGRALKAVQDKFNDVLKDATDQIQKTKPAT